ncbi:MAG TPA: DUF3347 domain-containing protein [Puia sp.]|nr:DUF3347 domain-containing protein [Puia sp.]
MRKFVLLIVLFIVAGLLVYRLLSDKKTNQPPPPDQALHISKNSSAFNMAFEGLMDQYFDMKDALVNWDTAKADEAAYRIAAKADSLPVARLKADSAIVKTAESLAASIDAEAKGFTAETGIEGRRRSFNMLTDELYNLIRTVRYDGQTVYHIRCPMAFGDSQEGFWLSSTPAIVNPYLGNKHPVYKAKMVGCGEITDSLRFGPK